MGRRWTARPHRLALAAAAFVAVGGGALLISPWDGLIIVLGWALIVAALITGALTLFLIRTPSS
ncbi:hypothetical protein [Curtobacterium sp. MCSS17_005]|uniref:hypothetical protein n=1 Tax=Curtobacterium sp. MCSS17_005 TaxID=2175641 RepID=UPI000DA8113A|nr:hypothetical protein [Curtobacterium sp. MCSS17_005]WIB34349.1 hypothetical protein DEJ20_07750 [Curtobacterium sp. MCSS17_005]